MKHLVNTMGKYETGARGYEYDPNFAFVTEEAPETKPETNPSELKETALGRPLEVSKAAQSEAYRRLFALESKSGNNPDSTKYKNYMHQLLREAISEQAMRVKNKGQSEITVATPALKFAKLEAELVKMFCALDNTSSGNGIHTKLENIKKSFVQSGGSKDLDSNEIRNHFPESKGIISAVAEYKKLLKEPLGPNQKRNIFLHDELDAKYATDFIALTYTETEEDLVVDEIRLIQVKSSAPSPEQAQQIHQRHEELFQKFLGQADLFQNKYYPELGFNNFEEAEYAFLEIYDSIMSYLEDHEASNTSKLEKAVAEIDKVISNHPNASSGGKTRYLAAKLFCLLEASVVLSDNPSHPENIANLIKFKINEYQKGKQSSSKFLTTFLKELSRSQDKLVKEKNEAATKIEPYLDDIQNAFPEAKDINSSEPKLMNVKSCKSVISKAGQTLISKELATSENKKYMIARP